MNNEASQPEHHKSHRTVFVIVFVMLCILTALSFWIANSHLMENQLTGWLAMMTVSVAKAFLVITFFMHLWWEKRWKYVLTIPALILAVVMILLLIPDIGMRADTYSSQRKLHAPIPNSLSVKTNAEH